MSKIKILVVLFLAIIFSILIFGIYSYNKEKNEYHYAKYHWEKIIGRVTDKRSPGKNFTITYYFTYNNQNYSSSFHTEDDYTSLLPFPPTKIKKYAIDMDIEIYINPDNPSENFSVKQKEEIIKSYLEFNYIILITVIMGIIIIGIKFYNRPKSEF